MLKQLLELVLEKLNEQPKKEMVNDDQFVEIVEEINKLEIKLAQAMASAERWGDLNDATDWRTVEVNRLKRVIQAKEKMLKTLKNNR